MANFRKQLKKYLSTQELEDRLTKLIETGMNLKRNMKKLVTGSDKNNRSTRPVTVKETNKKMCAYCGDMVLKWEQDLGTRDPPKV